MTTIFILTALTILLFITSVFLYTLYSRVKHKLNNSNEKVELIAIRKKLELAIGAADISIWSYNCEDQIFNALYGKLRSQTSVRYSRLLKLIIEPYRTNFEAALSRLSNNLSQKEVCICKIHDKESNSDMYFETQMTVSEYSDDNTVKSIVGTLKNVTNQYLHNEELENKDKKVKLAIQTSGLVQWEYDNITHLFNSSNEHIKGSESVLTSEDYFNAVHPDDRERVKEIIDVMNEGRDETILFHKRLRYSDNDNWHYTTVYGTPFEKDQHGKVIKYIGFRRDDTEWKNINERLEEEKMKAQEADKLKSAFLANMSHEIRTPLNAIVGFSQLLMSTNDQEERNEFAQIINVNNDLLLRLINDILDLSKLESGMMELKRETFDLASFFDDFATSMKQRITNPEVQFRIINPYRKCIVHLDKNRLAQILTNFATNAIKYTPKGYIKIGYEYMDKGLRLYVEDTGIGIPKEKQHRIFQRFEKLDDFAQGTGLGLSICKAISDAVGGRIGFESEYGKGSTFWAWNGCEAEIELKEAEMIAPTILSIPMTLAKSAGTDHDFLKDQYILVAEDKDSNYLLLKSLLKNAHIDRAVNGIEAVEMARMNPYSLILMDIRMPRMDGLEATRRIRIFDKDIPIIAVTANAFNSDRMNALDAGCNEYLTKPVKKQELLSILESTMHHHVY